MSRALFWIKGTKGKSSSEVVCQTETCITLFLGGVFSPHKFSASLFLSLQFGAFWCRHKRYVVFIQCVTTLSIVACFVLDICLKDDRCWMMDG
jgi:hypothetical protein